MGSAYYRVIKESGKFSFNGYTEEFGYEERLYPPKGDVEKRGIAYIINSLNIHLKDLEFEKKEIDEQIKLSKEFGVFLQRWFDNFDKKKKLQDRFEDKDVCKNLTNRQHIDASYAVYLPIEDEESGVEWGEYF